MLKKFVTSAFAINSLIAPVAVGFAVVASAAPAFAGDPPITECYVIEIVCERKDPTNCTVSAPIVDSDCDGNPG